LGRRTNFAAFVGAIGLWASCRSSPFLFAPVFLGFPLHGVHPSSSF
jgi:hypothetical protein